MSGQIQRTHLERRALVYVRQSTAAQVRGNPESTSRQYNLVDRAEKLGWSSTDVEVIDEDLGKSGATMEGRTGLVQLAQAVAQGKVGAILALEMSRLARSSMDWQQLLRLCGVAEVLVIDEERIYDPRDPDDRLLLDFKGTMSEMELGWLSLRMTGARQSKARRGELPIALPTGYVRTEHGIEMDPDEAVQSAIRTLFARFEIEPSASAVVRWAHLTGFQVPVREFRSAGPLSPIEWSALSVSRMRSILRNPIYAGVYAYGRESMREFIREGEIVSVRRRNEPDDWSVRLLDSHPGYITWEEYLRNRERLRANAIHSESSGGPPREGAALLAGLLICGRCGRSMRVSYWSTQEDRSNFRYFCYGDKQHGGSYCWTLGGRLIDAAVEDLFLKAAAPDELELTLAVQERIERQSEELLRGWRLRLEKAEYEARLSERRYMGVDPDNRVVARSLERDWEMKLREVERLKLKMEEVRREEGLVLSDEKRRQIRELASNLERVWRADTTAMSDRKAMLRVAIEAVRLEPVGSPRSEIRIRVAWKSGSVSEIDLPWVKPGQHLATDPGAIERIRGWVDDGLGDEEIATRLNEVGLLTGQRRPWSADAVGRARRVARIQRTRSAPGPEPLPDRHPDGRYSIVGAARLLGLSERTVRQWIARGLLDACREDHGEHRRAWWLSIAPADVERLTERRPPKRPPVPDRRSDGRYSISGAARRFNVSTGTIRAWIRRGLITWTREDHGVHRNVYWLEILDTDASRLEQIAAAARIGPRMDEKTTRGGDEDGGLAV